MEWNRDVNNFIHAYNEVTSNKLSEVKNRIERNRIELNGIE